MFKKDFAILFWGPNNTGYQYNIDEAGIYSEEEAAKFDKEYYCDDMPIQKSIVDAVSIDSVIDNQVLGRICQNTKSNRNLIGIKLSELRTGDSIHNHHIFCEPTKYLQLHENTMRIIDQIKTRQGE
jgi:hypothetical protein